MQKREVRYEIKTLARMIDREIDAFVMEKTHGEMSGMKSWVLHYLFMNQGKYIFQKDVEASFQVKSPTVTEVLRSMETSGYIRREAVQFDARLKKVVLTDKALALRDDLHRESAVFETRLTDGFTREELDLFNAFVERFEHNLQR